jgi:hypothetical protein
MEQVLPGANLRGEVRYMQRRAAERRGCIVTIGPLLLFSTDSGDAWILDPADHLAARIAEEGAPRPVRIEETETSFAVAWQGTYQIMGTAFVFSHPESGPHDDDSRLSDAANRRADLEHLWQRKHQ